MNISPQDSTLRHLRRLLHSSNVPADGFAVAVEQISKELRSQALDRINNLKSSLPQAVEGLLSVANACLAPPVTQRWTARAVRDHMSIILGNLL